MGRELRSMLQSLFEAAVAATSEHVDIVALDWRPALALLACPVVVLFVYKVAKWPFSGGQPGHPKDKETLQSADPFYVIGQTNLQDMLHAVAKPAAPDQTPLTTNRLLQQIVLAIEDLRESQQSIIDTMMNGEQHTSRVFAVDSAQQLNSAATPTPSTNPQYSLNLPEAERRARAHTPITPELREQLLHASQEDARRILAVAAKERQQEAKRPVYLSDEERNLSTEELYRRFKTKEIAQREADFLQRLPVLPPDAKTWSVTDIKRWFRDQRHEQWAVRMLREGRTLFVCPQCNRARDVESHRCVGLWTKPTTTRGGIPAFTSTYIAPTAHGNLRINTATTPDVDKLCELQDRLAKARHEVTTANETLARAQAAAQAAHETDHLRGDNQIFPYAQTGSKIQAYAKQINSQSLNLTPGYADQDDSMENASQAPLNRAVHNTSSSSGSETFRPAPLAPTPR